MTQSKTDTITINIDDYVSGEDITIDTSYLNDGTFTINTSEVSYDSHTWNLTGEDGIWPSEVEKMCKQYPALEKVWRNFKSVYDMVQQDYEGKIKAGEIDDDIPF